MSAPIHLAWCSADCEGTSGGIHRSDARTVARVRFALWAVETSHPPMVEITSAWPGRRFDVTLDDAKRLSDLLAEIHGQGVTE